MPPRKYVKRSTGPRKLRAKKSSKVNAAVKQYVSRTLSRSEETKMVSIEYSFSSFNSQILSPSDLITLMPQLSQGTAQNNRVGNTIRPVRIEVVGYITYYPAAATGNLDARMLGARLFCFQDKANRSYANSDLNYNLLNLGGSSTNYTGTALNWISPHNNDQFQFFADRKMTILKPYGYTNNAVPSTTNAITGMDKSMFHPFKIVLSKKHLPAVFKYDQTDSTTYPTNFNPKLALGYTDLLNASPDIATTQIAMSFVSTLFYKDG